MYFTSISAELSEEAAIQVPGGIGGKGGAGPGSAVAEEQMWRLTGRLVSQQSRVGREGSWVWSYLGASESTVAASQLPKRYEVWPVKCYFLASGALESCRSSAVIWQTPQGYIFRFSSFCGRFSVAMSLHSLVRCNKRLTALLKFTCENYKNIQHQT